MPTHTTATLDTDTSKRISDRLIVWSACLGIFITGIVPELNHNAVLLFALVALIGRRGIWQGYHYCFVAFAVWSILATLIQSEYSDRFSSTQLLFVHSWLPLLILPAITWSPKQQRLIIYTLIFALGYMTLVAILQSLFGADSQNAPLYIGDGPLGLRGITDDQRPPNVWGHPGIYGYGSPILFCFLAAYFAQELQSKKGAIATLIVAAFHFLIHKNRAGLMALMGVLPLTFTKNWSKKNLFKIYGIFALASIPVLIIICIAIPSFGHRMQRSFNLQDGRIAVWRTSVHLISQEPMFGYGGMRNVKTAYSKVPEEIQGKEYLNTKGTSAHNSVLSVMCSYGVIGGILWCISQIALFIYLYKNDIRSGLILLCAYQIVGLTHHASEHRALTTIVFLLIGLSIAFKQSNDRLKQSEDSAATTDKTEQATT